MSHISCVTFPAIIRCSHWLSGSVFFVITKAGVKASRQAAGFMQDLCRMVVNGTESTWDASKIRLGT